MAVKRVTLRHPILLICLLILLGAGGLLLFHLQGPIASTVARQGKAAHENLSAVDVKKLHKAITLAANYLVRACKPDGKFVYRINLDPEITPVERYNVLRHAGTMYALAMYYEWSSDGKALEALVRASRFLQSCCVAPVPGKKNLLAVWSDPELTRTGKPLQVKLGGTALGLVALLSLERVKPGSTSLADLRKLGRFVLYLQKEEGNYYSKYIPSEGGRQDSWTSLYYPGQAALGLLMLYHRDPSPEWLEASARALGYLARSREGRVEVPVDHWTLLATAKLLPLYHEHNISVPRKVILRHAVQICESIVNNRPALVNGPVFSGSFKEDGRTTPTATRLEGLLAALDFLPGEKKKLRTRMASSVQDGMNFLLRAQISSGKYAGGMPRAIRQLPPGKSHDVENFNKRVKEVRIDYVQHAMSAMIQYAAMFAPER